MNRAFKEYLLGIAGVMLASMLAWSGVKYLVQGEPLFAATESQQSQSITSGSYQLQVAIEPSTPRPGDNLLRIGVRDSQGMNVAAAKLRVVLEVPDHDSEQLRLVEFATRERAAGEYESTVQLPDDGEWPLLIEVSEAAGGHADLTFNLVTGSEGMTLVSATPQGVTRHVCPMHPSVSQAEPGQCPLCGMDLTPVTEAPQGVAHYTCPMHPSVKNAQPGQCPICGMDLAAVSHAEKAAGSIIVDQRRRQLIGLKTAPVEQGDLHETLRLIGKVEYDPATLTDIALPHDGKVRKLFVIYEGSQIKAGDPLFTVSSPDLYYAETDLIRILEQKNETDGFWVSAALLRLQSLGLSDEDIDDLIENRRPRTQRVIRSPVDGILVSNEILAGSVFWHGDSLMQIAEQRNIRVKASAYESDVKLIKENMKATVKVPFVSEDSFRGEVEYIAPALSHRDHTADVFVSADWDEQPVLANSYADVYLDIVLEDQLLVPEEAVIHSGDSRVVFVDEGEGRLQPRRIKTGRRNREFIQVLDGLEQNEQVVTSGNFLLASESKLKSGIDQW